MNRLISGPSRVINDNGIGIAQANYVQSHAGNRMSRLLKAAAEYGADLRNQFTYSAVEFREFFSERFSSLMSPNKLTGIFKPFNLIVGAGVIVFVIVYVFRKWTYIPPQQPLQLPTTSRADNLDHPPQQPLTPPTTPRADNLDHPPQQPLQLPTTPRADNSDHPSLEPPVSPVTALQVNAPSPIIGATNSESDGVPLPSPSESSTNVNDAPDALTLVLPSSSSTITTPPLILVPSSPQAQPSPIPQSLNVLDEPSLYLISPPSDSTSSNPSVEATSTEEEATPSHDSDHSENAGSDVDVSFVTVRRKKQDLPLSDSNGESRPASPLTTATVAQKISTLPETRNIGTSPLIFPRNDAASSPMPLALTFNMATSPMSAVLTSAKASSPMPLTLTFNMATSPMPVKSESDGDNANNDEPLVLGSSPVPFMGLSELVMSPSDNIPTALPSGRIQSLPQKNRQSIGTVKRLKLRSAVAGSESSSESASSMSDDDDTIRPVSTRRSYNRAELPKTSDSPEPVIPAFPPPPAPPLPLDTTPSGPPPAPPLPPRLQLGPPSAPTVVNISSDSSTASVSLPTPSGFLNLGSNDIRSSGSFSSEQILQVKLRKTPPPTPKEQRSRAGSLSANAGASMPNRSVIGDMQAQLAAALQQRSKPTTPREIIINSNENDWPTG